MRLQVIACIVLAPLIFGCSGQPSPEAQKQTDKPSEPFSHVIASEAEYYITGAQQGRPPDGKFPVGTKVNIIRQAGSYTQVRSESGVEATVASDAIKELGTDWAATSKAP